MRLGIYSVIVSHGRLLIPVFFLALLIGWVGWSGGEDRLNVDAEGSVDEGVLAAGFGKGRNRNLGWRGNYRAAPKAGAEKEEKSGFQKPSLFRLFAKRKDGSQEQAEIVVKKSSVQYGVDFNKSHSRWKYLSRSVRAQIDAAPVSRNRWKYLVIHNSATERGNASVFDYYHRNVKGMRNGLAYHFVIGNGTYSGDGEVEVGARWARQMAGGHVRSSAQNEVSIGICLVGDFDSSRVHRAQLEALDELMDYLQAKTGVLAVTTHRQINTRPTTCPGRYFPQSLLADAGAAEDLKALALRDVFRDVDYPLVAGLGGVDPEVSLMGEGESEVLEGLGNDWWVEAVGGGVADDRISGY
ncbi:MAG: peptidoglycan recognition family protein [Verrucomicrobiota bacterium]